jgi:predicted dehydrogenase
MLEAVDATVICLPNDVHARYALEAMERGKHALIEYPLCCSKSELAQLRSAAEGNNAVLMVGNTIVHEAPYRYIQANLSRLGTLLSAASRVCLHSGEYAGSWFMKPERRGPMFAAMHYHHVEYYRRLFGPIETILGRDESAVIDAPMVGGTAFMTHAGGRSRATQW